MIKLKNLKEQIDVQLTSQLLDDFWKHIRERPGSQLFSRFNNRLWDKLVGQFMHKLETQLKDNKIKGS